MLQRLEASLCNLRPSHSLFCPDRGMTLIVPDASLARTVPKLLATERT